MISTRGRYALRVMLDLAQCPVGKYIPMKEVAGRQNISLKYLEQILPLLIADRLIEGVPGKGGGYRLTRSLEDYTVGHILRLTEGNLAPVSCLECDTSTCDRADSCITLPMWKKYQQITCDFFDSITLADLRDGRIP